MAEKKAEKKTVEINGKKYADADFKALVPDVNVLDDMELVDDMSQLQDGNGLKIAPIMRKLLGDQYKNVLNDLRDEETGRVSVVVAAEFLEALMRAVSPNS